VSEPKRHPAFLAYLLLVFGWLYVFLFHRDNRLAVHHAKQSIVLTVTAVCAPVIWAVIVWVISWVPYGFLIASSTFSLVIAIYVVLTVDWIIGMVYALRAQIKPVPIVGGLAKWIPIGNAL
jgi:uncharacterized membrane protein